MISRLVSQTIITLRVIFEKTFGIILKRISNDYLDLYL